MFLQDGAPNVWADQGWATRLSISDISGQDIHSHRGKREIAIEEIRIWLANISKIGPCREARRLRSDTAGSWGDLTKICKELKPRCGLLADDLDEDAVGQFAAEKMDDAVLYVAFECLADGVGSGLRRRPSWGRSACRSAG